MESITKLFVMFKLPCRRSPRMLAFMTIFVIQSALAARASGQTFAEFFKQKKTQKKYLLQQIAALQVYIGYARQGYEIADQGISAIKGLAGGEFDLHSAFFASRKTVSPLISKHPHIMGIVGLQLSISNSLKKLNKAEITGDENRVYIKKVAELILNDCARDLEDLFLLVTSGSLEMKDDERLIRLNSISLSMQQKADFVDSFSSEVKLLGARQYIEKQSINHLMRLYEIDQ